MAFTYERAETVAILFGQYQTLSTYINIKSQQITWSNQAKYSGVYLDMILSLKPYITNLVT